MSAVVDFVKRYKKAIAAAIPAIATVCTYIWGPHSTIVVVVGAIATVLGVAVGPKNAAAKPKPAK